MRQKNTEEQKIKVYLEKSDDFVSNFIFQI